ALCVSTTVCVSLPSTTLCRSGDGRRQIRPLGPDQGRLIRGGHHHHRAGQPFGPQVFLQEVPHFPPPLADEGDDVHIGRRVPGDRSEEHTSELQSRENLVCRLL